MELFYSLLHPFKEIRVTSSIVERDILWNNKTIKENSVLLWDLENIPFYRLKDIKRVAKYTPDELYVITKQKLGDALLKKIADAGFKLLNKHKDISDKKIISMMQLFKDRAHMILISSDSDFVKEANKFIKKGKLQWILLDTQKRGVAMRVNLASSNLTISTLAHQPLPNTQRKKSKNKQQSTKNKRVYQFQKLSTIKVYLEYYRGKFIRAKKRVKKLYKEVKYHCCKQSKRDENIQVEVDNPIQGRVFVYRRNYKGRRVKAGSIQFNSNGEKILTLYTQLYRKYDMPSFKKHTRFYEFSEIKMFIYFKTQEQEYYLKEFERVEII